MSYKQMFNAMTECDSRYNGKFYTGVMTTGIYCLPSCKAKLPNIENVVFITNREEAIESGHDYFSAGYNIGYESSSGFREAFKKEFGRSPGSLIDGK